TFTLTVNPVVDLTATDDTASGDEDTTINGTLVDNAQTTSGGDLVFALVTGGTHGTATVNADGTYTYVPDTDFFGTDTFEYSVYDAAADETVTKSVTVTVNPVNDTPTLAPIGNQTINEDEAVHATLTQIQDLVALYVTDVENDPI